MKSFSIETICKEGFKIVEQDATYGVHYGVTLAKLPHDGSMVLWINPDYANRLTNTDLKVIRSIDKSFGYKGHKPTSAHYEIRVGF